MSQNKTNDEQASQTPLYLNDDVF